MFRRHSLTCCLPTVDFIQPASAVVVFIYVELKLGVVQYASVFDDQTEDRSSDAHSPTIGSHGDGVQMSEAGDRLAASAVFSRW